ncbi:MAG: hypothetical protein ACP5DZ_09495 [Bacteroidales bacterium]
MKKIVIIFFIVILFIGNNFAQQSEVGLNVGFGESPFIRDIEYYINPSQYFQIGFNYFIKSMSSPFFLKAELNYDFRGNKNINFNYIKLPLGFDYNTGQKLKFIIGGGFYGSYLFHYALNEDLPGFEESKETFQLGWMGDIGVSFVLSETANMYLTFHVNHDITKMYIYYDGCSEWDIKGTELFLKLGVNFNLKKENNE